MTNNSQDHQPYLMALKDKDPIMCQKIYNQFLPKVISMIKAKGGNEQQAKDVFQQSILAILLNLKKGDVDLKTSFEAYLKGICYYKFIDLCRKQKIKLRNEESLRLSSETDIVMEDSNLTLEKEQRLNLVWDCFHKLTGDCKTIIQGKLKGLSAAEVMKQINFTKSANAFYVKRFDCMRKLKSLIKQRPDYSLIKAQTN